ncbi:unnamed protein product [Symbiodinium natans]|uniref:Uncharacterized protein n=1 Tax=Symbiodinium natans TaxID=878477 RepID=A0A812KJI7_9DINO|nr:unnamed protein product [Symbiodinium natans]
MSPTPICFVDCIDLPYVIPVCNLYLRRKQTQYKPGECFSFDGKQVPRHLVVDVFEKVGTAQVSISDLSNCKDGGLVQVQGRDGNIVLDMQAKADSTNNTNNRQNLCALVRSQIPEPKKRVSRHQAAIDAQQYLEAHSVQRVLQGMVHELLSNRPSDPYSFMMGYIQASQANRPMPVPSPLLPGRGEEDDDVNIDLPDWSSMPGRGDAEYPGFASDGSQPLPVLSRHHSTLARVLAEQPMLYEQLKDVRTPNGVALAQCIKPGIDNKGHAIFRTLGLVAADETCFEVFEPLFRSVVDRWYESILHDVQLPSAIDTRQANLSLSSPGGNLLSIQVTCSRNIRGIQMPPSAQREERKEAERIVVDALFSAQDQDELLKGGEYFPLRGSESFPPKPKGMSLESEQKLKAAGELLEEPQSGLLLSSGLGRHWPEARGVFTNGSGMAVFVNEADHIRMAYRVTDGDVWKAVDATLRVERAISTALEAGGRCFSSSGLGFLSHCPTNVGCAMQASAKLLLPKLSADEPKLKALSKQTGLFLSRRRELSEEGERMPVWEVTVARTVNSSVETIAGTLAAGCRKLLAEELGEVSLEAQASDGHTEFPRESCPTEMPDISGRHSLAAEVLRRDPSIYEKLKDRCTPMGVSFATCIKTCFDNIGHRMIKSVGAVAGDEHSYDTFSLLFDDIIRMRHPNWSGYRHRTDTDAWKILDMPEAGDRTVFARIRVSRNLRGSRMLPACNVDERRAVEQILAHSLSALTGTLQGEYLPLSGSQSYAAKPGGMSEDEEMDLHAEGLLFEEPDSSVLVSSGYARDWPDARGVFVDDQRSFAAFVNELDHLRVTATDMSSRPSLKNMCERVFSVLAALEADLDSQGLAFARDDRLGFLGPDPSLLGTCLIASVAIRLPLLSKQPEFRNLCQQLKLQASLCANTEMGLHQGVWEVQNSLRLGSSEVEQVNAVIEACRALLDLEARLEMGEKLQLVEDMDEDVDLGAVPRTSGKEVVPGTGDVEFPGFPADECPRDAPDLSRHHSIMAEVLTSDPSIYSRLKDLRTPLGVSLARCIKPGVDNVGHSFFRVIGAAAGDAHCYDVFQSLFDPIIMARQNLSHVGALRHAQSSKPEDLSTQLSGAGETVASVQVSVQRNLLRFRFTPAMSLDDRQKVEKVLCAALAALPTELAGEYAPLRGSTSTSSRPGISEEEEAKLLERKWLFEAPDAPSILATGRARHWPQARGVFVSHDEKVAAWINDEDHLRLMVRRHDSDLKAAFSSLYAAEKALAQSLSQLGHSFARSDRLGFLTCCPSNLGAAFRAKVRVTLPLLGQHDGFSDLVRALGVQAKRVVRGPLEGVWDISNVAELNTSEVEQANSLIAVVRKLHDLELQLRSGQILDLATEAENFRLSLLKAPQDTSGLGADEVPGFPVCECPEELPDLSGFNSILAELLKRDPELYSRLRNVKTSKGVSLARCIKPGMDNKARNAIRSIGLVAGDAESYSVFSPIFVPALSAASGYQGPRHPQVLDPACVSPATCTGHVVGARVEASRNLADFCFPSAMTLDARAELERIVTKVMLQWEGDLAGDYLPLSGSGSFVASAGGMTAEDAADLEKHGLLFQAPSSAMLLSSGMGKHWPEARGVYVNSSKDMAIWVNEEDHLRLITTASSPQKAFDRFCTLEGSLKLGLQHEGLNFASHEVFGFLTSCPSKVGTGGFQVTLQLKLALVEDAEDRHFEDVSTEIESQGVLKMKAAAKMGQSEADMVQAVVSACEQLIAEEIQLAKGS